MKKTPLQKKIEAFKKVSGYATFSAQQCEVAGNNLVEALEKHRRTYPQNLSAEYERVRKGVQ